MVHPKKMRAVPFLIVANTAIFLLLEFFPFLKTASMQFLALSRQGLFMGRWWELVSYAFLHGSYWHLLFNMAGLWLAGRLVERVMGTGRFLALYFLSAIMGGLFQLAMAGNSQLIGASGAVSGVLLAFATMFPEMQIMALLFFVVPLRLRAKYLGWGLVLSALFLLLIGFQPGIGHAAHLGGCVTGYLFARLCGYGGPTGIERRFWAKLRSART